jgi:hypothetical protein
MERAAVFAGACFSSPSVGDPTMPTEFTVPRRVFRAAWTVLSVTLFCEALNQPGGTENEEVPPSCWQIKCRSGCKVNVMSGKL